MGKLEIKDQEKSLILNEITRLAKENEKDIKMWEERYAKSTASHEDEVKNLVYQIAGKQIFTCDWFYFPFEIISFD